MSESAARVVGRRTGAQTSDERERDPGELAPMRIDPAGSCNVANVRSLWRNGPHWHAVWPEGPTWCYPTAKEAADRAIEVTQIRAWAEGDEAMEAGDE